MVKQAVTYIWWKVFANTIAYKLKNLNWVWVDFEISKTDIEKENF